MEAPLLPLAWPELRPSCSSMVHTHTLTPVQAMWRLSSGQAVTPSRFTWMHLHYCTYILCLPPTSKVSRDDQPHAYLCIVQRAHQAAGPCLIPCTSSR